MHSRHVRKIGPAAARALRWATIVVAQLAAVTPAAAQRNASVWVTSSDQTRLLARQADVPFVPDTPGAVVTIDVDGAQTFQQFDGVGGSMTESSAWLMATAMSDGERATLMTQLFDPIAGVGLSILRQPIGASDFALSHYSYDDMPAGQTDVNLLNFSIAHDRTHILPALRAARQLNPSLLVMASPWSAPGWMKTLGSMIRGELKPEYYAPYAAYLVKFLQAYAADGVPVDAITVQNEPHFTGEDYPGMYMTSADQTTFIRDHLAPALGRANLTTAILAFDQNWSEPNYPLEVFADPAARGVIAGSAFHCYAGDPSGMNGVHTAYPDKTLHVTECSPFAAKTFAESLMWTTRVLVIGSTRNWAQSVVTWNLALDEEFGPHLGGCADCIGLVTINRATATVTFNAAYYALGHVSKFVHRGATRVASTTYASSGVDDVTFRNPDGSYVLIVSNDWSDRTIKVRMGSESFSYALAAGTVATFTWPGGSATPPVPAPPPARWPIPGLIEAENFDQGGEGRAYHDVTAVNSGGVYRNEGVDIEATTDAGVGYNVGWMSAGEWLAYSIDVTQPGGYVMDARVASNGPGGTFHVEVNGVDKTGPIVIPDTHGWQSWVTVTRATAPLAAGAQRLRVVIDANGANGDAGNLNYIRLSVPVTPPPAASTSYTGTPAAVPGLIEAENFDNGGEGLAYHDLGAGNTGGQYRVSDVDIEATTDTGSGYDVGWMQPAEWLKYTVNVGVAGAYRLDVRVAASGAGGTFHVEANQIDVSGPLTIPNTGGWQTWRTISRTGVTLGAGVQVLRVVIDAAGATGIVGNLNYLQLTSAGYTPGPAPVANLALGHAASSSSTENASYGASLAVDGAATSRWSSAFSDPQWLAVDLGASAAITRVVLRWETAYGADYEIQTSNDNTSWTTVRTVIAGDGGTDDLTGLTASGRYVRVYGKRRATPWGYSLWEFEVWGTVGAATP